MFKLWFIEPRPNVFVGTANRRTRNTVLEYVRRNSTGMSILIITSEPHCQGFKIGRWSEPDRRETEISGLWLVAESWNSAKSKPTLLIPRKVSPHPI